MNPPNHLHDATRAHSGHADHDHADHTHTPSVYAPVAVPPVNGVLGWPAWQRVLAVLPVLLLMWLAVWWAGAEATPW